MAYQLYEVKTNMLINFNFLLQIMNAKKNLIWLFCLCTVSIVSIVAYNNYSSQSEITTREKCFAGSIDACVALDKTNKDQRALLEDAQLKVSESNKSVKTQTQKLLSGSSFQ